MEDLLRKVESLSNQLNILQKYVSVKFGCDFECFLKTELAGSKRKRPSSSTTSTACGHHNGDRNYSLRSRRSGQFESSNHPGNEEELSSMSDPLGMEMEEEEDSQVYFKVEPFEDNDNDNDGSEDLEGLESCLIPDDQDGGGRRKAAVRVAKVIHDPDYSLDSRDGNESEEDKRVKRLRKSREALERGRKYQCEERKAIDRFSEVPTETPGLRVFPGNRGAYIATLDGFLYQFYKKQKDRLSYICDRCKGSLRCRGRISLTFDHRRVLGRPGDGGNEAHSHPPCHGATDVRYGIWRLKTHVELEDGFKKFKEEYEQVLSVLSPEGKELIPTLKGAEALIQKERRRKFRDMKKRQQNNSGNQSCSSNLLLPDLTLSMNDQIPDFSQS